MGVHIFSKGICPKVNQIECLDFEHDYYDVVVQNISPQITRTLLLIVGNDNIKEKKEYVYLGLMPRHGCGNLTENMIITAIKDVLKAKLGKNLSANFFNGTVLSEILYEREIYATIKKENRF